MDNLFLTRYFDWSRAPSRRLRLANSLIALTGSGARLAAPHSTGRMSSIEQRINIYHLVSQLLVFNVPGAIVEFGALEGESAALLRMIVNQYDPSRPVHVFDAFVDPPLDRLVHWFRQLDLKLPEIHKGLIADTIDELPEQICFTYIDLGPVPQATAGPGASHAGLYETVGMVLEKVYPRVAPQGIILMQDYLPPYVTDVEDLNPQVFLAADAFFADKPVTINTLYGGPYMHAFMRKLAT